MTVYHNTATFSRSLSSARSLARDGLLSGLFNAFVAWQRRSEMRQRLAEMDNHQLSDLGITRDQARREARKPFWMV